MNKHFYYFTRFVCETAFYPLTIWFSLWIQFLFLLTFLRQWIYIKLLPPGPFLRRPVKSFEPRSLKKGLCFSRFDLDGRFGFVQPRVRGFEDPTQSSRSHARLYWFLPAPRTAPKSAERWWPAMNEERETKRRDRWTINGIKHISPPRFSPFPSATPLSTGTRTTRFP